MKVLIIEVDVLADPHTPGALDDHPDFYVGVQNEAFGEEVVDLYLNAIEDAHWFIFDRAKYCEQDTQTALLQEFNDDGDKTPPLKKVRKGMVTSIYSNYTTKDNTSNRMFIVIDKVGKSNS